MADIKQVADAADMIVNGYAFTRCTEGYRVLNLNRPDRAAVFPCKRYPASRAERYRITHCNIGV